MQRVVLLALLLAVSSSSVGFAAEATPSPSWLDELQEQQAVGSAPTWGYTIVAEYPHDPTAFTEGLVLQGDVLFEGTGLNGQSRLQRSDLISGEIEQRVRVDDQYFGEGIAIIGDRIFQLTWKSGIAFVYDLESFQPIGQFVYEGEGWGLTTDGEHLIMSNGSNEIVYREPETFAIVKSIQVSDESTPVTNINELEWINGEIWANIWQTDLIARIDPETGAILGWIDLTGLLPLDPGELLPGVLNGIAWDPQTERLFVTGKNWPTVFQIELVAQ